MPVAGISTQKIVGVLPVPKELGFRSDKGGRREREDEVLLLLREGVNPCHARESRPLDGVPVGVSVVARIGIKEGGKNRVERVRKVEKRVFVKMKKVW